MNAVTIRQRERARSVSLYLDYRSADGKRHNKPIGRARHGDVEALAALQTEAELQAARIKHELLSGTHRAKVGDMPIENMLAEFLRFQSQTERAQSTRHGYKSTIKVFREFLDTRSVARLSQVTPALVVAFIQHARARGLGDGTIALELVHLSRIFARCVSASHMISNPFAHPDVKAAKPTPPQRERAFTAGELAAFLKAVVHDDYRDFFHTLAETGLRLTEAIMLRWCDVSLERRMLRVTPRPGWGDLSQSTACALCRSQTAYTPF